MADLESLHQEYVEVNQRLLDHQKMLKEEAEERWQQKKFFREARIIEGIMLSTFARTKGCHHVWQDSRGRHQMETPKFQQSGSNADSHWFLLQTTIKERFGHRDVLPYGVDVADLVSERVTENLSVALGFQVEVRRSPDLTKIYYRVNRLDSPDGLPKYFAFQTMFQFYPERQHDLLPFPLGVFDNRRVKWSNLKDDPHILIAGKSKHGKSNYLNNLIAAWIQFHSPQEIRFLLCDFKGGVEFTIWKNIPHLLGDFVKAQRDLLPRLREVRRLIDTRLALMEKAGKTDLASYNQSLDADQRLPQIVVVIDELQDLVGKGKWTRKVHHLLSVIGSLGRAPGITLILSTQFPNKEVVPMSVKANMSLLVKVPDACLRRANPDDGHVGVAISTTGHWARAGCVRERTRSNAGLPSSRQRTKRPPRALPSRPTRHLPQRRSWSRLRKATMRPMMSSWCGLALTQEDLLSVAVDNFDCNLKARPIYRRVRTSVQTTEEQVSKLIKHIVEQPKIEFGGVTYQPVKQRGNFFRLIPIAVEPETPDPEATDPSIPVPAAVLEPELVETT